MPPVRQRFTSYDSRSVRRATSTLYAICRDKDNLQARHVVEPRALGDHGVESSGDLQIAVADEREQHALASHERGIALDALKNRCVVAPVARHAPTALLVHVGQVLVMNSNLSMAKKNLIDLYRGENWHVENHYKSSRVRARLLLTVQALRYLPFIMVVSTTHACTQLEPAGNMRTRVIVLTTHAHLA